MKKAENSEKHPEIWKRVFSCMKNQDGASLMAALLFFVFCGVGASIILASASASAGKIRNLPGEDQKRYAVDSAAVFLRDELQKTENIVKIKEVIVHDSRGRCVGGRNGVQRFYPVSEERRNDRGHD